MLTRIMRPRRGYGSRRTFVNRAAVLAPLLLTQPAAILAALAAPPATVTHIVAFGDSLTAGYGVAPNDAFPTQLAARLTADGYDVEIANAGVSGDTTSGGLARLGSVLGAHPDIVLLELGANDALRGIDPKLAQANLDRMLARLSEARIKVVLLGMKSPGNWGTDYRHAFDGIYPSLAAKYNVPLYPFFLDGVVADEKLNQEDGIHPNKAGVAVIVARIAPFVEHVLGKATG